MKTTAQTILVSLGALIAICGLVLWQVDRPPFDLALLDRLHTGMAAAEVQQILGAPKNIYAAEHEWAYARPMSWTIVYVRFDEHWQFREHAYDY